MAASDSDERASDSRRPATARVRRSILMTPGHRGERLAKAARLPADCLAFDLEDGVPRAQKPQARRSVAQALAAIDFGTRERTVRVNAVGSDVFDEDLRALPLTRIDCLFIPKVESRDEVEHVERALMKAERLAGRSSALPLILSVETPKGLFAVSDIATASARACALFLGSGDYAAITGIELTPEALQVPRALLVAAAGLAGIQAVDAAYFRNVKDAQATGEDARAARALGFSGKLVFHPAQLAAVNEAFTPTTAEIRRARRLIAGFEAAAARGEGAVVVDGEFVARDIVPVLERTLQVARQLGLLEEDGAS